tara:strand:+ start:237 stop:668 length:432 start_codon:yes stop_codon:yes gene_type:complete
MKEYKPFKMKRGPFKVKPMRPSPLKEPITASIIAAIKSAAAVVGKKLSTTAAGKALTKLGTKVGSGIVKTGTKVGKGLGKVAATQVGDTTVGNIAAKQALSAGVSKIFSPTPPEEVEKTGVSEFSKLNFGNRSTFTMKRNIKK